ncbi:MAG: 4Fe-4S binding protein [bacterium]
MAAHQIPNTKHQTPQNTNRLPRVGIFICHCGINIAGVVDVKKVADEFGKIPGVVHSIDYKYMCSNPGQELITKTIKEKKLNGVIVAACSPRMHETTFRNAGLKAGLNPYCMEIANIREQCSWVHQDEKEKATEKGVQIISSILEKLKGDQALEVFHSEVEKKALVIGAGIAGIQVALDIAQGGYPVILVEKEPYIGGHMTKLAETFPTLDCAACILTPRTVEVSQSPKIKIYTYSEIEEISGLVGDFKVKIRKKARSIIEDKCTGCGICQEKCPRKNILSEYEEGMGMRKAVYIPFPQAVPNIPVIDRENCTFYKTGKCKICQKFCEAEAIDFEQQDEIIEEKVGVIVVSTGYKQLGRDFYGEYGYGRFKDVINSIQFERLQSATGPTRGEIRRPSDGKIPRSVVFIQCVGSRDRSKGIPYCSSICCMYTAKHAMLYKHKVHDGQAYVFYIDVRAPGKGYEEFWARAVEEDGAVYLKGRVSRIFEKDGKVIVRGSDTLSGTQIEIAADMVVLASAICAHPSAIELAKKLRIPYDEHGFFSEVHPKLRPLETTTMGIFLAGACQAPKDIPSTVAQASGSACKVLGLLCQDKLSHDPVIAVVDEEICSGCGLCVDACSYEAREIDEKKKISTVKEILCQGCGACAAICPNGATQLKNFTKEQIFSMIDVVV